MKKLLFSSLFAVGMLLSIQSNAADWSYCSNSVQITSSSWQIYINKTWAGGGPQLEVQTQYRHSIYDPSSGTWSLTAWQDLPSSGYIGISSANGGFANYEIREIDMWMPGGPVIRRQFYVGPC